MPSKQDSAVIFSGGLDSTTLVYDMLSQGYEPHLLSFNYGQRHKKELEYAKETAFKMGLKHDIIDLSGITNLISNSALTSHVEHDSPGFNKTHQEGQTIEVPEGHYAEDTMKATVVPNRNMIMLSIAAGVAVNNNYKCVATGVHAGDHFIYPDCRPIFIQSINDTIGYGNAGFGKLPELGVNQAPIEFIYAPFIRVSKTDIAVRALELNVPLADTWSCYKGEEIHCGKCGTCVERLEAIHDAIKEIHGESVANRGVMDPTRYADSNYWKFAVGNK